ncbi:hypothetical protein OG594_20705 [Streptomyces sp. NBC_01214]|uniref:hypothetical protein n=1 Tax=Streptomyces sp. NBC_01214 TaxID=2903777 RepID=UPI002254046A|nr:hypothetical protein [Streptomyces sp. NBC_01214]MCX4804030.1 hypothetical protein [Streptomyces sp. NBC_01214]
MTAVPPDRARIEETVAGLGLMDRIRSLPEGLGTRVGTRTPSAADRTLIVIAHRADTIARGHRLLTVPAGELAVRLPAPTRHRGLDLKRA